MRSEGCLDDVVSALARAPTAAYAAAYTAKTAALMVLLSRSANMCLIQVPNP